MLSVPAYAKVNLSLELLGKRDDGFHEILTIMQSISLRDELEVEEAREISLQCDLPGLEGEGNLVLRAARALQAAADISRGARIRLWKGIPMASGLGGASADAACALVALARLWGLDGSGPKLGEIAGSLGSDVPFFLSGGTALACGRGEQLESLPSPPERWLVLLVPPHSLQTKTAELYRRIRPEHWSFGDRTGQLASCLRAGLPLDDSLLGNSFEAVADQAFPSLPSYREAMLAEGSSPVHLSGAGPTIFCLVENRRAADGIAARLRSRGLNPLVAHTISLS
jgi:4-diphosphocytidyl-2-C-methyl-D-erythritol kinase